MKKSIVSFLRNGFIAAAGGPVVLAIVYLSLHAAGVVETLDAVRISTEILTVTLMAFIAGGITVVYQIERLPLLAATLIHFAALYADCILFYLLNGWIGRAAPSILIFTAIFLVGYAVVWLSVYLTIRKSIRSLNRKLHDSV